MKNLDSITKQINALKHDIRAEVIINDLINNNEVDENQYIIQNEGQFSRAYRFDVLHSEIVDFDYDSKKILQLNISRDSIYDMLPENISHHTGNDVPNKDVDVMIREYQTQKKQQKEARNFFQPFENEMFSYGVSIENLENNFLFELNSYLAPEMFYDFWGIDKGFPVLLISKFIRLLPFAYKIVGNIEQTCHILSVLIEEEVKVTYRGHQKYTDENQSFELGENRLGLDTIAGTSYDDYSNHLDITIGPLKNSSFTNYIHEGNRIKFVRMFYEHFFPIEVEINTIILLPKDQQNFNFTSSECPVLGYNTRI
ncbi:Type VI secretion, VasB, ImpH, VC_A0111 [Chryseobacterium soldanellicola]|uniref:Type VI secretion, VasB, ImpH, VC_A0111 n=1 Tax=Chryseobacterium soldanellicola TaxID=311333 RepID=A0A1H0YQ81_9FLAO|nr:type VI secretion system baseplate subunit TssG [Chryseobacterium soldanellicola]SDQ17228.1 Type VI secretion, VasB, ImpH, VC_A0111 [Chryseobacterium soldanellicola]